MSKIKQEEFYLWNSIIPELKKNIEQCIKQLKQKMIRTYPPDDYQFKINKIKHILAENDDFDEQQYIDVFTFLIDQKLNVSLLQLSDQFVRNFGRDNDFWIARITQWGSMMTFTNSLVIWNIHQFMRNFVNYSSSPIQRDLIYKWRPKAQAYISSLSFLIKKIQKTKKTDNAYVLDQAYIKYHKEKVLYMTFVNKLGLASSDDSKNSYIDEVTVTFQNKSKAEKKLFNFPHATKTLDDIDSFGLKNSRIHQKKSGNTLDKYFGKNGQSKNSEIEQIEIPTDEQQRIIEHQRFVSILQKIGKIQAQPLQKLRQNLCEQQLAFLQQKRRIQQNKINEQQLKTSKKAQKYKDQQNKKIRTDTVLQLETFESQKPTQYALSHLAFFHNPQDFYWHVGYPLGKRNIDISDPFRLYDWVNYFINDQQEYQQMMAILIEDEGTQLNSDDSSTDLDDEESEAELQELLNDESFIDNRKIITGYNEFDDRNLAPQDRMQFAPQVQAQNLGWVANSKIPLKQDAQGKKQIDKLTDYIILPIYDGEIPYPIEGFDDARTKRRQLSLKIKNTEPNIIQPIKYEIEEITQTSQEDNSTTNFNSRPQRLPIIEPIQQMQKEQMNYEKNIETTFAQSTFEQKMQELSMDERKFIGQKIFLHEQSMKEYEQIRCVSEINSLNEIQNIVSLKSDQSQISRSSNTITSSVKSSAQGIRRSSRLEARKSKNTKQEKQQIKKQKDENQQKDIQI